VGRKRIEANAQNGTGDHGCDWNVEKQDGVAKFIVLQIPHVDSSTAGSLLGWAYSGAANSDFSSREGGVLGSAAG
jgi:hypothetical protein